MPCLEFSEHFHQTFYCSCWVLVVIVKEFYQHLRSGVVGSFLEAKLVQHERFELRACGVVGQLDRYAQNKNTSQNLSISFLPEVYPSFAGHVLVVHRFTNVGFWIPLFPML